MLQIIHTQEKQKALSRCNAHDKNTRLADLIDNEQDPFEMELERLNPSEYRGSAYSAAMGPSSSSEKDNGSLRKSSVNKRKKSEARFWA